MQAEIDLILVPVDIKVIAFAFVRDHEFKKSKPSKWNMMYEEKR